MESYLAFCRADASQYFYFSIAYWSESDEQEAIHHAMLAKKATAHWHPFS